MTINRQPQGIPVGGQFSATAHAESDLSLRQAWSDPYMDSDGTTWESVGEDDHADVLQSESIGGFYIETTSDVRTESVGYKVIDKGRGAVAFGIHPTLDEARAAGKEARTSALSYGRNNVAPGAHSPWGPIQSSENVAPGIDSVYTAGHGGYKLSAERNRKVDPAWRRPRGWYEEDCDWAIAAISHKEAMSQDMLDHAHKTSRKWHPDEYEAVVGANPEKYGVTDYQPIAPGESSIRDTNAFWQERADTHDRVLRATPAEDHPGMVVGHMVDAPKSWDDDSYANPRTVLMPKEDYDSFGAWKNRGAVPRDRNYSPIEQKVSS